LQLQLDSFSAIFEFMPSEPSRRRELPELSPSASDPCRNKGRIAGLFYAYPNHPGEITWKSAPDTILPFDASRKRQ
jgi:hypothetical protein